MAKKIRPASDRRLVQQKTGPKVVGPSVEISEDQAIFAKLVAARRYGRVEGSSRPETLPLFATVLTAVGGALRVAAGDVFGAGVMFFAASLHGVFTLFSYSRRRERSKPQGEPDPSAALSQFGELLPRLYPGETLLAHAPADGPDKPLPRLLGGAFQSLWGVLLAGLPVTLAPLVGAGLVSQALLGAFTALGAGLFGRGMRALLFTKGARYIALTDQRVVALFGPGAAKSIPLSHIESIPVVVGRQGGQGTVAFALRPQDSVKPLPVRGLYGLDNVPEEEAKRWAQLLVDERNKRGG